DQPDRDLPARPDPGADQPAGDAIDLGRDLTERVATLAKDQRFAVAPPRGGRVGQIAQACRRRRVHRRGLSAALGQLDEAAAEHGELAVLIARFLRDLDEAAALPGELLDHGAVDPPRVALGSVATDLAMGTAQDAVVAHPVGQMMREPRAPLRAV